MWVAGRNQGVKLLAKPRIYAATVIYITVNLAEAVFLCQRGKEHAGNQAPSGGNPDG